MHYLSERHILIFLLQVLILLSTAKVLGELCRRKRYPALAGEMLAGILLGPTILGRVWPALQHALFPPDVIQQNMLETMSWLGVLFLLLATGFEVKVSTVWRQRKEALSIGTVGVLIPIVIGIGAFWWLPDRYLGETTSRPIFVLFLATAAAISAIPVMARILHDLEILKSDLGLVIISAFTVNDILGWMIFTFVLGLSTYAKADVDRILRLFFEIALFTTVCLSIGSRAVGLITRKLRESDLPYPATMLTFISGLGLLCGAITQWIGIHAIFGFFLAGIMAGDTPEVSERTRRTISEMVHAVFVPLFFAGIGTKIDFLRNLDIPLVLVFTAVAIGAKFVGAWLGAVWAKLSKPDALSIGIAHIPGGAMEIVVGVLALEFGLISDRVFVPIVFAAISSSVLVGPWLAWSIKKRSALDVRRFLRRHAILENLRGETRWEVMSELCEAVAEEGDIDRASTLSAVREREETMGTGLDRGVAVPHARLSGLDAPMIAFGRSRSGVDWDALDGLVTHFVFLILTPEQEEGAQTQILAAIARIMQQDTIREDLMMADNAETLFRILNQSLAVHLGTTSQRV